MAKPTTKELRRMLAKMSVQKREGQNPISNSAIVVQPETAHTESNQITGIQNSGKNDHITACLEVEQHSQTSASQLPKEQDIASSQSADSPCSESTVIDYSSASYSSDDEPCSGYSRHTNSLTQDKMYTPRMAKEISAARPGIFIEVTMKDATDRIEEEDDCADGMVLRGFLNGLPLYYKFSSLHKELLAIQTRTTIGTHCVNQPIETCLGWEKAEKNGDDSGCYTEPAEVKLADKPTEKDIENTNEKTIDQIVEQTTEKPTPLPPNRTFSNRWFKVAKSPTSGFGMFAIVDIPASTHILLEHPFLTIKQYSHLEKKYRALDREKKAIFDSFHGYHKDDKDPLQQKWNANHFCLGGGEGVFAIASNFNHACKPMRNTQYRWDAGRQVMTFTTTKAIAKGEEIFISYGSSRSHIFVNFGFICQCGGCEHEEWEPVRSDFWDQF